MQLTRARPRGRVGRGGGRGLWTGQAQLPPTGARSAGSGGQDQVLVLMEMRRRWHRVTSRPESSLGEQSTRVSGWGHRERPWPGEGLVRAVVWQRPRHV